MPERTTTHGVRMACSADFRGIGAGTGRALRLSVAAHERGLWRSCVLDGPCRTCAVCAGARTPMGSAARTFVPPCPSGSRSRHSVSLPPTVLSVILTHRIGSLRPSTTDVCLSRLASRRCRVARWPSVRAWLGGAAWLGQTVHMSPAMLSILEAIALSVHSSMMSANSSSLSSWPTKVKYSSISPTSIFPSPL